MSRRPTAKLAVATCVLLAAMPMPAFGDDIPPEAVRQTFMPDAFSRFAPRTALDMARQVPGFSIEEGDQDRGFGQADTNVLVNGRRISGKSNGPVEALGRIPVDTVVRLDIVDGASLDIGGLSGQVLNVVTSSDAGISGRYQYSPQYRTDDVPTRWRNFSVALSGGFEGAEWTLSVYNDQNFFGSAGPEFVYDGTGELIDLRQESSVDEFEQPGIAGSFTREFVSGSVLNVTGEVNWFFFDGQETSMRDPVDSFAQTREFSRTEDEFNFEVGADYEWDAFGGRLKLIGLHRFEASPTVSQVQLFDANAAVLEGSVFDQEADEAETVLRAEFTHAALGGDWQWSLEGTQNYVDIEAALAVLNDSGVLEPVELAGASSRVEEDRAEITISYSRPLSERLQVQSSLGVEYSEISQSGAFGQTRDFVRPKGFVSLNWRATDSSDLSIRLERQVGQLNFFDFIASVNVNQDRVNVTNADLVPPQSWLLDLQLQQSLGDYGSVTLSGFYEDISDSVDLIPIEGGGQAPGNVDTATRIGASINLTLLTDAWAWRGGRMDLEGSYVDSSVADPLLGNDRRISDDDYINYELVLRQDFAGTSWATGFEFFYNEQAPQVRLDEISIFKQSKPFARWFVENKDVFGMTVRGSIGNLLDRSNDFSRTIFVDRVAGEIAFREERFRPFGTLFRIDVEGSF
ncbi:MAG: hypothetical protein AAAFM81_01785 [Pseudomonadota bacterium]